jgi:hypothetical protein
MEMSEISHIYCEHAQCENQLNPFNILKCRHHCCTRCYQRSKNTCAVCIESKVNKVLTPLMYKIYDYYAILKGLTDTSVLFSQENIKPMFDIEVNERLIFLSWKVDNEEKLEKFMAIWNAHHYTN